MSLEVDRRKREVGGDGDHDEIKDSIGVSGCGCVGVWDDLAA